jgi:inhibitor of KinA
MSSPATYPHYRPVADHALLVEFSDRITGEAHDQVRRLDAALSTDPIDGFAEAVPAYASLLVAFDPMATDHKAVEVAIGNLLGRSPAVPASGTVREVLACYEDECAPDLDHVAATAGLSREQVAAAHLSGEYSVFMYGFAPGYAYLAGVPVSIQLPRKPSAVRNVPAGSVLISGPLRR